VNPYRKHLERLGMLNQAHTQVPAEVIEVKGFNKTETLAKMREVEASVEAEKRRSGKGTFIHAYCNGRAALWEKELQIKYLGEKAFYPLEAKLKDMCGGENVFVWAAFNCARDLQIDPKLPGFEQVCSSGRFSCCITTHAVGLGEGMGSERDFAEQIAASLQSFLHSGSGSFELISSLESIHSSIAMTSVLPLIQPIILRGKVP